VLKYEAVWFGWQTENGVSGCKHEEDKLHAQTAAVKAQGGAQKTTLVYGADVSNLMTHYDKQRQALSDPSHRSWFLHEPRVQQPTTGRIGGGMRGVRAGSRHANDCSFNSFPAWDFTNVSARNFFAEVVIGQWADDPTVDSVFVDEADALVCYWPGPKDSKSAFASLEDLYRWSNGSVMAYKQAAQILASKGKRLVVSLKNGFNFASPVNAKVGHPCAVPMDEVVKGMAGVPWIRFHEYFADLPPLKQSQPRINGSTMCHNMVKTTMRQASLPDMAFAVHGGTYNNLASFNLTFAMFMLGRNGSVGAPTDFFSWSTGEWNFLSSNIWMFMITYPIYIVLFIYISPPPWMLAGEYWYSRDWSWKNTSALYEFDWGVPLGRASQQGSVWTRNYERATISVDCATLKATIAASKAL
jgi:hypothetical protein